MIVIWDFLLLAMIFLHIVDDFYLQAGLLTQVNYNHLKEVASHSIILID